MSPCTKNHSLENTLHEDILLQGYIYRHSPCIHKRYTNRLIIWGFLPHSALLTLSFGCGAPNKYYDGGLVSPTGATHVGVFVQVRINA